MGLRSFVTLALAFFTAAVCTHAQDRPHGEFSLGYSYASQDFGAGTRTGVQGYELASDHNVLPWLAIVFDSSSHFGSPLIPSCSNCATLVRSDVASISTEAGGVKVLTTQGRFTPFTRALFGIAIEEGCYFHGCTGKLGFAQSYGGGVDVRLSPRRFGLRFSGDYLQTRLFGAVQNDFRVSTGFVIFFYPHQH